MLGCTIDDYRVHVTERCDGTKRPGSGIPVAVFEETSGLSWGRVLNNVSKASIDLPAACTALDDVSTWRHELTIFRREETVWQGPIVRVNPCRDGSNIIAWDMAGWLARRVIHETMRFRPGINNLGRQRPTDIAYQLAVDGFRGPFPIIDDPCGVEWTQIVEGGDSTYEIGRKYRRASNYTLNALRDLAAKHIDFTTVGRALLLMAKGTELGRTALLTCDSFSGDVCGPEDGTRTVTLAYVRGDGVAAEIGGESEFYGLLEVLHEDDAIKEGSEARIAARDLVRAGAPPLRYVDMPSGAVLAGDAPVQMGDLVAGVTVPVILDCLSRQVSTDGRLTELAVQVSPGAGEQVSISLEAPRDAHADITGLAEV